jgi:Oxidoreductase family, NAD-binding Rossmann fold
MTLSVQALFSAPLNSFTVNFRFPHFGHPLPTERTRPPNIASSYEISASNNNTRSMSPNPKLNHRALEALIGTDSVSVTSDDEPPQQLQQQPRGVLRCAILGCGMMGQEHCSYISGFPRDLRLDYLCDPHQPSLDRCAKVWREFALIADAGSDRAVGGMQHEPRQVLDEQELLEHHVHDIDLLVIASPNYLHTDTLLRWGRYEHLTILVEKPVAVSEDQLNVLRRTDFLREARIWVAMEYRFIPAIAKLIDLIPDVVGDIKMVTIRENRYPFLHKIGGWNRDRTRTGDSLVEKWYVSFLLFLPLSIDRCKVNCSCGHFLVCYVRINL